MADLRSIKYGDRTYDIPQGAGALPDGGTTGQALVKNSDADQDVKWADVGGSIDAYTKAETDVLLDEKASLNISTISGGGGGDEISATVSQGTDSVNVNYYKDSELPNALNLIVGADGFLIPTTDYVNNAGDIFRITVDADAFVPTTDPTVQEMELTTPYTLAELNAVLQSSNVKSMVLRMESTTGATKSATEIMLNTLSPTLFEGDLFYTDTYMDVSHLFAKVTISNDGGRTMLRRQTDNVLSELTDAIAPTEISPSNNAYSAGQLLLYNGQLYEVSQDIAVGDELTVGTNIHATTVDTQLMGKQNTLVSGTNIKTVNGESLLGSGDLDVDEIFYIPVDEDDLIPSTVQPQGVKEGILTTPYTIEEIWAQHTAGKLCAVLLSNTTDGNEDRFLPLEFNGDPQVVGAQAWNESLYYDYTSGTVTEPTAKALVVSIAKQTSATKVYVTRTDMRSAVDQSYDPTSTNAQSGTAVAEAVGDLSSLATTAQDNLVNAVNELKSDVSALGEPFRVKEWDRSSLNIVVPMVTEEIANTSIDTFLYQITGQEATDYQIVGMIAYQLLDANNTRINAFPVCQFTGGGQTELRVRFMCGGTSRKTAASIKAWVLLKHR